MENAEMHAHFKTELTPLLEPPVLKHLPPSLQLADGSDAVDAWIAALDAASCVHTVRSTDTSQLLGLLILAPLEEPDGTLTIHLGYLFSVGAWGKGYATELIRGLVAWCEDQPTDMWLLGGVEIKNSLSAAVLQKAGFVRSADLSSDDTDMFQRFVRNGRAGDQAPVSRL
ncbi:MAG: GNAT family N-acetyltransferase [Hyphomicrobiales bacterium]|nr:GNAT family N-acetyltransferase [Hyphomicrobiales bacterium]